MGPAAALGLTAVTALGAAGRGVLGLLGRLLGSLLGGTGLLAALFLLLIGLAALVLAAGFLGRQMEQ